MARLDRFHTNRTEPLTSLSLLSLSLSCVHSPPLSFVRSLSPSISLSRTSGPRYPPQKQKKTLSLQYIERLTYSNRESPCTRTPKCRLLRPLIYNSSVTSKNLSSRRLWVCYTSLVYTHLSLSVDTNAYNHIPKRKQSFRSLYFSMIRDKRNRHFIGAEIQTHTRIEIVNFQSY